MRRVCAKIGARGDRFGKNLRADKYAVALIRRARLFVRYKYNDSVGNKGFERRGVENVRFLDNWEIERN